MPQLDLATYPGMILCVTIFFFLFFLLLIQYFLPVVLAKFLALKNINLSYDQIQFVLQQFSLFFFLEKYTFSFVINAYTLESFELANLFLNADELDFLAIFSNYIFCEDVRKVDIAKIS